MTNTKEPASTVRIRFQDCDPFGHLNNARYIDYFLNAREDHISLAYGLDLVKHQREHQRAWMVSQNQVAYFKPALPMEEVKITTRLLDYSEKRLLVEMLMHNASGTQLKAVLWASFVHVDTTSGRSVAHSEELTKLFAEVVYTQHALEKHTFEQRLPQLLGR